MELHLGFTGTRQSLTDVQHRELARAFKVISHFDIFHHGDCVGADTEAHYLVENMGKEIWIHPSTLVKYTANNTTYRGKRFAARDPLERNQQIVNWITLLIACPSSKAEAVRSGTWTTVRYARKKGIAILVIYPDGMMKYEMAKK
jgi:hypothetical protein